MTIWYPALGATGRLGNQLWEVASTVGIAWNGNEPASFPSWDYWPFFSVPGELFRNTPGTLATDCVNHLDPRARPYLQDLSLFEFCEERIRKWFAPSHIAKTRLADETAFWDLPEPVLSVHVRRGDNVQKNDPGTPEKHLYHPLRSLKYYESAINRLRPEAASIAVFSDDIEWCREMIPADYYHIGVPRDKDDTGTPMDWVDLFLMASCGLHVLSNSTFGWWGAFLSSDRSPIYPSRWFGPKLDYIDSSLMFPSSWVEMEDPTDAP